METQRTPPEWTSLLTKRAKVGALTENRVKLGTRHGGATGAQEQGLYHRPGDAAMLGPPSPPPPP